MKHAIIILAHKDLEDLEKLVSYFTTDCYVFIHIDKKVFTHDDIITQLSSLHMVMGILHKYNVNWGGYSILKCEMFMLKYAMKMCNAEYFHIISAQDYPVRPLDEFLRYFEINKGYDFIQYRSIPNKCWERNTFFRFQYFFPYDYCRTKESLLKWKQRIISFQRKINFK